jgi:hypothetical protein
MKQRPVAELFRATIFRAEQSVVLEQANTEPPMVSRARKYIAANKGEALSLTRVAQAAGASVFYSANSFAKQPV